MTLRIVPVFQKEAKRFINRHHRHNVPSLTAIFCIGIANSENDELVGVAMVGLPKARMLAGGKTLEVTRACTDGTRNANSMLYGACARAAKALGWERLVTYTLTTESGASLKAAGWKADEEPRMSDIDKWATRKKAAGRGTVDLFGNQRIPDGPKIRWWKDL
jgi:hypothetical protein